MDIIKTIITTVTRSEAFLIVISGVVILAKPEILLLSSIISTKRDVMQEIPRSEKAIANIRTYLKFKTFKIDYSKIASS